MAFTRSVRIATSAVLLAGLVVSACGSEPVPASSSETSVLSPCATSSLIADAGASLDMSGVDESLASWLGISTSVVQGTVTDAAIEFTPIETDEEQEVVRSRSALNLAEQQVLWRNPGANQIEDVSDQAVSYLGPAGSRQELSQTDVICVGDSVLVFVAGTLPDMPGKVQALAVVRIVDERVAVYPIPGSASIPDELASVPTKYLPGLFDDESENISGLLREVINYPMSERPTQIRERERAAYKESNG